MTAGIASHIQYTTVGRAVAGNRLALHIQRAICGIDSAAVIGGITGHTSVNRCAATHHVQRTAVDCVIVHKHAVYDHRTRIDIHGTAVIAVGFLERGTRIQRKLRSFGIFCLFDRDHHVGVVHIVTVYGDLIKRQIAVANEHIAFGEGRLATIDSRTVVALIGLFACRCDGHIEAGGDLQGIRIGHRVIADQHFNGLDFTCADRFHRSFERIEGLRTYPADVLRIIVKQQLSGTYRIVVVPICAEFKPLLRGIVPYIRHIS